MTAIRIAAGAALLLFVVLMVKSPKHAWRWHSGHTLDGRHLTDATWTRPATRVLHPTGNAVRWHKWPRLLRAGIRTGFTVFAFLALIGILLAPWPTLITLGVLAASAAGWAGRHGYRKVRRLWP